MTTLWQDIRYGVRILARSPGFTTVVLLVIGVAIGANTALFNVLDQVYMRPLPVEKPHELVSVQFRYRQGAWEDIEGGSSYAIYEAYRDRSSAFAELAAFREQTLNLRTSEIVESVKGAAVSINYFSMLGLQPVLGRLITPQQGHADPAYQPIAVISHRLWHRRFEGRRDIIGERIVIEDRALTVIGVAPAGFHGTMVGHPRDIYIPLGTAAQILNEPVHELTGLCQLGRLKPEIDREQAQAALQVLYAQIHPPEPGAFEVTPMVAKGHQGYVPGNARVASYPLALFFGIAVLVLVIACANVANLQLARATTRHREIAIRQALGAGRRRIIRQLLVESLLLASVAGAFGVVLAVGLDRLACTFLPRLVSANMPAELQVHITPGLHPRVLLFAMAVSLGTGITFGLAPALRLVRRDVIPALKESANNINMSDRRWNPHSLLVVGQIAVALVVTVCSGLCLRNLIGLKRIDPGFDPARIVGVSLSYDIWPTHDRPEFRRFFADLQERVNHLPGVASTSLAGCVPVSEASGGNMVTDIEGFRSPSHKKLYWRMGTVSPGYFHTFGQALLSGRNFTPHDGPEAPKVIIVNDILAKRYWPDQNPVGKRVTFFGGRDEPDFMREVVGVVESVKLRSITEPPAPIAYLPLAQKPRITPVLLVRTDDRPGPLISTIRREAAAIQPAPACDIRTVAQRISGLLLPQRILTGILNSFALVGLFLSATGIYAVMAYAVRQRTREIGIRIALGAQNRHVLMPVLLRGTLLMAIGMVLGLGLSLAGSRLLAALLPRIRQWDKFFLNGIGTWDLATYLGAAVLIAAVILAACYLPARRAAKVDPMAALRYE